MSDLMVSSTGQSFQNYDLDSEEGIEAFNYLKTFFPNEVIEDYASVATPYIHEVFNTECIRTCVSTRISFDMLGEFCTSAHRVFVLNTGESYFISNQLFTDEQPAWKPEKCFIGSVMEPHAEYKNNAPEGFDSFKEYFVAMRHEIAIANFNFSPSNAGEESIYSILVNSLGNVISVRCYSNYFENSQYQTLQNRHLYLCRRGKRIDLARELRDGNYVDL